MNQAIQEIQEIVNKAATWLESDGSLTMAALDVISFAKDCTAMIKRNDIEWIWSLNPFNDTGEKSDIIIAAHGWARRKFRRRIEDRLRKSDYATLHEVGKILGLTINDNWVGIESSHSGQSIQTSFGRLTHTNGHFSVSNIPKTFWFSDLPAEIGHQTYAGTPASCGYAKFHIQRLEDWLKSQV